MDNATLVGMDFTTGSQILKALDDADLRIKVALIMSSVDHEDWRLVISSPDLDREQPLKAYEQVVDILRNKFLSTYRLPAILIMRMRDPFIRALRDIFAKTSDVNGMRLGGQIIGNRFVRDAIIYRIK